MPPSLCRRLVQKRSNLISHFFLLTSVITLLLILLLAYNLFTVFCVYNNNNTPIRDDSSEPIKFPVSSVRKRSNVIYAVTEEHPLVVISDSSTSHLPFNDSTTPATDHNGKQLHTESFSIPSTDKPNTNSRTWRKNRMTRAQIKTQQFLIPSQAEPILTKTFSERVKDFFWKNNSCKLRFFMTWISSLESVGHRELFTIESLFKSNPNACLLILSNSIDSREGRVKVIQPFLDRNFHITAISPDYKSIFKNTAAASWFNRLQRGKIKPGEVSLGQNLSNLLRLALLYKYGGIYMDTDFLVLKSFKNLRNVIGAQSVDRETKRWNRLNNAVLIFDKKHPLLRQFIDEFVLTFNGNIWGFNGPYLVTRVVQRFMTGSSSGRKPPPPPPGFNLTVLPPSAFYPVDWNGIGELLKGPNKKDGDDDDDEIRSLNLKLDWIRRKSYAVHLWNRESRKIQVEQGSIISRLMLDTCIFCNFSAPPS